MLPTRKDESGGELPSSHQPSAIRGDQSSALTVWCRVLVAVTIASMSVGCRRGEAPAAQKTPQMIWRAVGSWSGSGNRQTESFTSDTGALRVRWETKILPGAREPGAFRLTANSAVSGRVLQEVVDERGAASGVDYVSTDPHVFYMAVESTGVQWTFSVDEGIAGEIVGSRR
jgi:hypothetical protein